MTARRLRKNGTGQPLPNGRGSVGGRGSKYVGGELNVFSNAKNWKRYIAKHLRGYVGGDVLEVGSGLGSVTGVLSSGARRWMCLEPDPDLLVRARSLLSSQRVNCEFVIGTLETMSAEEAFDAILYIDVLEHIEDDRLELLRASRHVNPNGVICVLAPAHPMLYSEFDKAIGHFRRYTKATLSAAGPPGFRLERLVYLDCCGWLASAANRFILRSAAPGNKQIAFWDRVLVSLSRVFDPVLGYSVGKSVLGVWRRIDPLAYARGSESCLTEPRP
jgi:ubiquinone/menaquinone biosynthesis C-methylase UbiE